MMQKACVPPEFTRCVPLRFQNIFFDFFHAFGVCFFAKNAQSALTLGHARGVILLKFSERHLPIHEYQTLKVKQSVVGVGRADKDQVQHMVKILLILQHSLQEDEADALAVAITHAHLGLSLKQSL